jgi:hypothetical protein
MFQNFSRRNTGAKAVLSSTLEYQKEQRFSYDFLCVSVVSSIFGELKVGFANRVAITIGAPPETHRAKD